MSVSAGNVVAVIAAGAAIVAFGPLATIVGLVGATGRLLGVLLGASALFALGVLLTVRVQIKGWPAFARVWRDRRT